VRHVRPVDPPSQRFDPGRRQTCGGQAGESRRNFDCNCVVRSRDQPGQPGFFFRMTVQREERRSSRQSHGPYRTPSQGVEEVPQASETSCPKARIASSLEIAMVRQCCAETLDDNPLSRGPFVQDSEHPRQVCASASQHAALRRRRGLRSSPIHRDPPARRENEDTECQPAGRSWQEQESCCRCSGDKHRQPSSEAGHGRSG
jgi:hypothetical protein